MQMMEDIDLNDDYVYFVAFENPPNIQFVSMRWRIVIITAMYKVYESVYVENIAVFLYKYI